MLSCLSEKLWPATVEEAVSPGHWLRTPSGLPVKHKYLFKLLLQCHSEMQLSVSGATASHMRCIIDRCEPPMYTIGAECGQRRMGLM